MELHGIDLDMHLSLVDLLKHCSWYSFIGLEVQFHTDSSDINMILIKIKEGCWNFIIALNDIISKVCIFIYFYNLMVTLGLGWRLLSQKKKNNNNK